MTTIKATPAIPVSAPPMKPILRTIRDFVLWSYERGTIQYDIMVTLILVFVFFSPRLINYKDKPIERNPHPSGVIVTPDVGGVLIYQVEASAVASPSDDAAIRTQLLKVIEPISGAVSIAKYEPVPDPSGHVTKYKVWVIR